VQHASIKLVPNLICDQVISGSKTNIYGLISSRADYEPYGEDSEIFLTESSQLLLIS